MPKIATQYPLTRPTLLTLTKILIIPKLSQNAKQNTEPSTTATIQDVWVPKRKPHQHFQLS
ncbi:hypothetical protein EJD97_009533, partial [Solanum chilense]